MRRSRSAHGSEGQPVVEVVMPTIAPFDGTSLLRFFAARAVPGVEEVEWSPAAGADGGTYRRCVGGGVLELRVRQDTTVLRVHGEVPDAERHAHALFDLDADPAEIGERLGSDGMIGP